MNNRIHIPRGEIVWVSYKDMRGNTLFFITSKQNREYYYLYSCLDDSVKKLGKNKNPIALETEHKVIERCAGK